MKERLVGLVVGGAACLAAADVVTNAWTTPAGGYWLETNAVGRLVNWADAAPGAATNIVADFALDDEAAVRTSYAAAPAAGFIFRPRAAAGDARPSWRLVAEKNHAPVSFRTLPELGHVPLRVEDGALVFGDSMEISPADGGDDGPFRKEGSGAVRFSHFLRSKDAGARLDVAEGAVFPMSSGALAYTDVRVTGPAGALVFTNAAKQATLGSFAPQPGVAQPLNGVELRMGAKAATVVPGEICGTGRVTAVVRSVYVTNVAPDIVYGASAGGRLRLDTTQPAAVRPFARYDFETSLTADASGHGRTLTAEGAVERVWDETRGGYVARFTATAASGGRLKLTATGADALTGDADYTVSLWARAAQPCANAYPTFFSLGTLQDHSCVQFRFQDAACARLLLGHWIYRGDFSNLAPTRAAEDWNPALWHHYVAMREGGVCSVWVDGRRILLKCDTALALTLPETVKIVLGGLVDSADRFFHGDLDDVRIYAHALGTDGVARLFAGDEPIPDGGDASAQGAPPVLPEATRLSLDFNGVIQLAGAPTLAATNVAATGPRGALDLPTGGTLTLTGPGAYPAGVTGTGRFVKDGPGRLVLSGALAQTGGTEVKAGALVLQGGGVAPPPCLGLWDFEAALGADASAGGFALTTQAGVERVWDAERGGWVAQFPGGAAQRLEARRRASALTGDADYTISVWAKPDADCPATGTLLSLGDQADFQEVVFRFKDINAGTMVLSHWGGPLDFADVTTPPAPQGAWHHYVAVRKGTRYAVWVDGKETWSTTKEGALALQAEKALCLGRQISREDRSFKGRLDDAAVYACALDAEQIARLFARGPLRAEAVSLPAPVLHYAFEDAYAIGHDSAPGGHHLEPVGQGTFTRVASPLGGKALQFDPYDHAYLQAPVFPDVLPTDGRPFTVSLWVQTSSADNSAYYTKDGKHAPSFICWGEPGAKTIGFLMAYSWDYDGAFGFATPRCYVGCADGASFDAVFKEQLPGLREASPTGRWHHYAAVYEPATGVRVYVDGVFQPEKSFSGAFATRAPTAESVFLLGAKATQLDTSFRGALDEVKVFAAALDERQIRAVMRADAGAPGVLPTGGDVAVAEGATLEVDGAEETVGALSGKGTVDLAAGALTLTNAASAFEGTLAGNGTLRLAAGATLALAAAPTAFTGCVELAGGALALPEGVATIPATFRVAPIDPTRETICAGDVEIPDGTALALTTAYRGPFVTARGRVIVRGGGSVTLPNASATGVWTIAAGAADVRDDGEGPLAARWQVANLPPTRTARFAVSGGAFTCTVQAGGTLLLVR